MEDALVSRLARFISESSFAALPRQVSEKTKLHLLDTLAAAMSGSRLAGGIAAVAYLESITSSGPATVIGQSLLASVDHAALANGMMAHSDETDDSHLYGRFHPGCAIVPAALAVAERLGRSGAELLTAISVGYDVGTRVNLALRPPGANKIRHSTHSIGATFGAAAASASLLRLTPLQSQHVMAYAAQQASGVPFWQRDSAHVEKAFDFGGMGARNGVTAASMVAAGCSAVDDPFAGDANFLNAFSDHPNAELLTQDLGTRFEVERASVKKWSVGSPLQAALDALESLIAEYQLTAENVVSLTVHLPDDRIHLVDDREMPDLCAQHLTSLMLIDGDVTFDSCHDLERMRDEQITGVRRKIRLVASPELTRARPERQAIVEAELLGGRKVSKHVKDVRGTPENPMSPKEVEEKARNLISPIIGNERSVKLITTVRNLEELPTVLSLRPLLQA